MGLLWDFLLQGTGQESRWFPKSIGESMIVRPLRIIGAGGYPKRDAVLRERFAYPGLPVRLLTALWLGAELATEPANGRRSSFTRGP